MFFACVLVCGVSLITYLNMCVYVYMCIYVCVRSKLWSVLWEVWHGRVFKIFTRVCMLLLLCVSVPKYVCVWPCIYVPVCLTTRVCVRVSVCVWRCMYAHICVWLPTFAYECSCICVCIYVQICVCAHVFVYVDVNAYRCMCLCTMYVHVCMCYYIRVRNISNKGGDNRRCWRSNDPEWLPVLSQRIYHT